MGVGGGNQYYDQGYNDAFGAAQAAAQTSAQAYVDQQIGIAQTQFSAQQAQLLSQTNAAQAKIDSEQTVLNSANDSLDKRYGVVQTVVTALNQSSKDLAASNANSTSDALSAPMIITQAAQDYLSWLLAGAFFYFYILRRKN